MIKQTVFCDVCTREKKDANGWWQIHESRPTDMFGRELTDKSAMLILRPYEEDANMATWKAACGRECLHKVINVYVQTIQILGVEG